MTILGIGVDIVHLPRISALVARRGTDSFARRILSAEECQEWRATEDHNKVRFLAVRFCVKEAAYKAMYPTVSPTWKDLTYRSFGRSFAGSKPELTYKHCPPTEAKPFGRLHVSVSHDGEYVFSTVIADGP